MSSRNTRSAVPAVPPPELIGAGVRLAGDLIESASNDTTLETLLRNAGPVEIRVAAASLVKLLEHTIRTAAVDEARAARIMRAVAASTRDDDAVSAELTAIIRGGVAGV